jgi:hypothetical protein
VFPGPFALVLRGCTDSILTVRKGPRLFNIGFDGMKAACMPSACTLTYVFILFFSFFFAFKVVCLALPRIAPTSICAHVRSNSPHSRLQQQRSSCAHGAHGVRLMKTQLTRAPDSPPCEALLDLGSTFCSCGLRFRAPEVSPRPTAYHPWPVACGTSVDTVQSAKVCPP